MILADLVLGAGQWKTPAIVIALAALAALVWAYSRAGSQGWVRGLAALLPPLMYLEAQHLWFGLLSDRAAPVPSATRVFISAARCFSAAHAER